MSEKMRNMWHSLGLPGSFSAESYKPLGSEPTIATSRTSLSADPPTTEPPPKPKLGSALRNTLPKRYRKSARTSFSVLVMLRSPLSQETQELPAIEVRLMTSAQEPSFRRFILPTFFARPSISLRFEVTWSGSLALSAVRVRRQVQPQEPSSSRLRLDSSGFSGSCHKRR